MAGAGAYPPRSGRTLARTLARPCRLHPRQDRAYRGGGAGRSEGAGPRSAVDDTRRGSQLPPKQRAIRAPSSRRSRGGADQMGAPKQKWTEEEEAALRAGVVK